MASEFEVEMRPPFLQGPCLSFENATPGLTKDARSAFGLKRDPHVWHEACV